MGLSGTSADADTIYQGLEAHAETVADATLKAACIEAAAVLLPRECKESRDSVMLTITMARDLYWHVHNSHWDPNPK